MKETLLYLLQQLVEHPQEITIEEVKEGERIIFAVRAHPDDLGKIIGRNGRIIRAIRDLIKIVASKHNTYVDVVLAE